MLMQTRKERSVKRERELRDQSHEPTASSETSHAITSANRNRLATRVKVSVVVPQGADIGGIMITEMASAITSVATAVTGVKSLLATFETEPVGQRVSPAQPLNVDIATLAVGGLVVIAGAAIITLGVVAARAMSGASLPARIPAA